ncbi:TPR repeat family protein [Lyngbya aestuarii BL J]|uniref:TPR repeat family protein n=2 Tax=Lyngbya aestuarii TaxID=118322 RepID=U7QDA1_9CYAN|nr:TPR repeat family protein [Lyngbya aestuarii BL J]
MNVLAESPVLAQSQDQRKAQADQLLEQGIQQYKTSQFQEALQSFQQALEIYREIGDRNGEGRSLGSLGNAYRRLGQYQEAIEFYQQWLTIAREIGDRNGEAGSLGGLGNVYNNLGQYQKAIEFHQQWLAIAREIGDRDGEASSLGNLGNVYYSLGQYQKAIEFYQQWLTIAREIGDRQGEGTSLGNLGSAYGSLGQYQKAIEFYQQWLTIAREIGDRQGEGTSLGGLGIAYSSLGQYQKAIEFHQQWLTIAREIGDRNGEAGSLGGLGNAYRSLGQYQKAIEFHQQWLTIAREIGDRNGEAGSLGGLGNAYDSLGQYQKAIEFHQQSLAIRREIGDRSGEAFSLNNLGWAYNNLGQYQKAIEFYQQSLAIFQKIGTRNGEALSLSNMGWAYHRLGQSQKAIEFHQQSLAIYQEIGTRNGEARSFNNLGAAYDSLGQYQKAIEFYQQSLAIKREIGDRNGEAFSLNNLGWAYHRLGQSQKAIEFYQQSLAIFQEISDRSGEALSLSNIGSLLEQQNQPELAITFLKQSVNVTELIRKDIQGLSSDLQLSYIETIEGRYRRLADLLLKENRVLEAQRVLDLLKVQELEDYLKNVRGNTNTASGIEFYQPEQEILSRYNELQQNVIEIGSELKELQQKENLTPEEEQKRNRLDQLLTEVKQQFNQFSRSPEIRSLIEKLSFEAREQTLSLGELDRLRDKLGELNAVLFYPLILEDRLELVITTPNSPPLRRTVNVTKEELYRTIVRFRLALQDPNQDAVAPAQKLYKWLFEPLENDLKAANTEVIIYAPDGVLRYIPLVALHDGKQWLAQRFRVNNITAASLEEIDTQPQPEPKVLAGAFADQSLVRSAKIGERDVQFAGLPFAGIEVEELKNTLPNTTAYVDEAFSLEAIKPQMNGYNVLHFATHAAFVPGDPSESFIVFGEGENPTLRDVENWSLSNVDLVVLSACETGLGGFDNNGEQILGLGYQFQNQGARAVMASLWKVSDGGTQVLMNSFYAALQQGYTKTEALQIAQNTLITGEVSIVGSQRQADGRIVVVSSETELPVSISENLDHPYYWASFILIGNGL